MVDGPQYEQFKNQQLDKWKRSFGHLDNWIEKHNPHTGEKCVRSYHPQNMI